jgi:hypothetical protein
MDKKNKPTSLLEQYYAKRSRSASRLYMLRNVGDIEPSRRNAQNGLRKKDERVEKSSKTINIIDGQMDWENRAYTKSTGVDLLVTDPNIVIPIVNFTVQINSPTSGAEFTEGDEVTVSFTTDPIPTEPAITKTELLVNNVAVAERENSSLDDYVIESISLSATSIKVRCYYDAGFTQFIDSNTVSITVSQDFLLDLYPNQFGESWALVQRNSEFTGNVITIRRSSDNATQSYGFVDGELPISTIASFVGAGDGLVTWWKGQANGLVVEQSNAANQPFLFKSGVLQTEAGLPTLKFEGNQWLNGGNILSVDERSFVSAVVAKNTGTGQCIYAKGRALVAVDRYALQSQNQLGGGNPIVYEWFNRLAIRNQVVNNGLHKAIDNNQLEVSQSRDNIVSNTYSFLIGAFNNVIGLNAGFNFLNGNISEVHIWLEDQESNLSNINGILNADYGIY